MDRFILMVVHANFMVIGVALHDAPTTGAQLPPVQAASCPEAYAHAVPLPAFGLVTAYFFLQLYAHLPKLPTQSMFPARRRQGARCSPRLRTGTAWHARHDTQSFTPS